MDATQRTLSARRFCSDCSVVMVSYRPRSRISPPLSDTPLTIKPSTSSHPITLLDDGTVSPFARCPITSSSDTAPCTSTTPVISTDVDDNDDNEEGEEDDGIMNEWKPSEEILPSYLRAYLGSSKCQRNMLMHVCVSDSSGDGGALSSVGKVVVVRPGSLRHGGHFAIVQLRRAASRACGWTVAETRLHRL